MLPHKVISCVTQQRAGGAAAGQVSWGAGATQLQAACGLPMGAAASLLLPPPALHPLCTYPPTATHSPRMEAAPT